MIHEGGAVILNCNQLSVDIPYAYQYEIGWDYARWTVSHDDSTAFRAWKVISRCSLDLTVITSSVPAKIFETKYSDQVPQWNVITDAIQKRFTVNIYVF